MLCNGSKVLVVVPFGQNRGQVVGRGVVVGRITGGPDGDRYLVKEAGRVGEYAASWVKER